MTALAQPEARCPVCQARFRGSRACSRCGADLAPLMRLALRAWRLRQAARRAIGRGEIERALELASEGQQAHATPAGESLRLLSAWLSHQAHEEHEEPEAHAGSPPDD